MANVLVSKNDFMEEEQVSRANLMSTKETKSSTAGTGQGSHDSS